jgi:hypothetical protein
VKAENLIYDKKKYVENYPPKVTYIPSEEIMFKIMRSLINCKKIEDFFIFR